MGSELKCVLIYAYINSVNGCTYSYRHGVYLYENYHELYNEDTGSASGWKRRKETSYHEEIIDTEKRQL